MIRIQPRKRAFGTCFSLSVLAAALVGSAPHGTAQSVRTDSLVTVYRRGLNTDLWEGRVNVDKDLNSVTRLVLHEILASSRLTVSAGHDKWKDTQILSLELSRMVRKDFRVSLLANNYLLSDKQSGYTNDIQTHFGGIGLEYRNSVFAVPLSAGVKWDRRFGSDDVGPSMTAGFQIPETGWAGYRHRVEAGLDYDLLDERRNHSLSVAYRTHRQFHTQTWDSLQIAMGDQRRDYYVSWTGDIESRMEKNQSAQNVLTYGLGRGLSFRVRGSLHNRTLIIRPLNLKDGGSDRERHDFMSAGAMELALHGKTLWSVLSLSASSEDQTYRFGADVSGTPLSDNPTAMAPDNRGRQTTLSLVSRWRWSSSDSLSVLSRVQRFRYDTPDPVNFDDRDEWRFRLDLREIHTFSQTLTLRLNANLNLLHLVYIHGEKSADNSWTRILRFSPSVAWRPLSGVNLVQSAEVLANYVDYDYETLFAGTRSFLYRKFRLDDSVRVSLSSALSFRLAYRLELDENGKFLWDSWTEQRLVDRESHTIGCDFSYAPIRCLVLGSGFVFFSRQSFQDRPVSGDRTERVPTQLFQNYGPVLMIRYQSDRMSVVLSGSAIVTHATDMKNQTLHRMDLTLRWAL